MCNSKTICSGGGVAEFFHAVLWTDMKWVMVLFPNFSKVPEIKNKLIRRANESLKILLNNTYEYLRESRGSTVVNVPR